jgi:hypothetical protein
MMTQTVGGANMGEMRNVYIILVGKSVGKNPFGIPRIRCENNIKIDLKEDMRYIHMTLHNMNFLFYYLFNDTLSSSGYVVSDGGTINE